MRRSTNARDELVRVIRSVRRRWRWRVVMRGAAVVLGAGVALFLISAFGMDSLRFTPEAVVAGRVVAYGGLAVLLLRFLVWPLARRVSDERVALYLEEHEPSLQAQLLSAVELDRACGAEPSQYSPAMVRRLIESAVDTCASIDYGRRVERAPLARASGVLAGGGLATLAILVLAPPFVRHSAPYLFPLRREAVENPYSIAVSPGDAKVAKGGELRISAVLNNFEAEVVELGVERKTGEGWRKIPMTLDEASGEYLLILFDLEEPAEYFVEAGGVRSPVFRIDVAELPYVQSLALEYHFPSYTGLPVERHEEGGDIAALEGTEVRLEVTPTIPVASGAIVLEEGDSLPLAHAPDGGLTGSLTVTRNGMYKIVFETLGGDLVAGSPDYLIDALSDQPPFISFSAPGRDTRVTSIEEVFVEVEARDDFGLRSIELVYSVNGEKEDTIGLYGGQGRRRELNAGHTFYLEEIDLVPGDFISYYARASDANAVSGREVTTTDIYFMEVRPFSREYRQAEGSGGGGGGGGFDSSLSRRQRDIIAATFKVIRDREEYTQTEFNQNLATLALGQGRLREQVDGLLGRMRARGILGMDSSFAAVAEALPLAVSAMKEAEERLGEREPEEALPPEQRALQHLQRAEAAFREVQVSRGEGQGGGGSQLDAEELAELFELELDRQRNQYESVQRERRERVNEEVDEVMQKLQELARRQQQNNERLRARQSEAGTGSGGEASQRQLAEEAEELARKLERLSREESRPELNEISRRLRRAAEAMRRASARSRDDGLGEGISALDALREARRLLEQSRSAGLVEDIDDAIRRAERLAQDQRDVTDEVGELEGSDEGERRERVRRLLERKEEMAEEVAGLEAQLDRLASDARSEQRDASRRLSEAANSIRDDKLKDKILYSRGVLQQRSGEYARNFEEQIAGDLDELKDRIQDARAAVGESRESRLARSLDRARDLTRSLESLRDRIAESTQGSQSAGEASGSEGESADRTASSRGRSTTDPLDTPTGDGLPGLSRDEARQFQRELRERRGEMEELRRQLERDGIDARELERIAGRLRQLERQQTFGDPRGLEELQAAVIQGLKEFEFGLRREMGLGVDRELLLSGSDEVPAGYRELVEEYYRVLAGERSRR